MDREYPTRRRLLRAGGLLGTAALAGCTGSSDEGTPPDVGTMTELDPVGPVNVVTTFDGTFVPEFWSFMGGPAGAVGVTPNRAMDGEAALYCQLGSSDHQVLGIQTSPEGFPMEDGDSFFAWTYVPHDDAQVEFGLTAALDDGDVKSVLTVPSLYRSSDGIVYRQADGDQLAETTLGTEFGAGRWIRLGTTVYPSTDEVRYSVADEYGRHQRTDRVPMNASFTGEYSIYAVGHHHQDAEVYVDRITAGPYRKPVDVETTDRSGGLDQDLLTADGYRR